MSNIGKPHGGSYLKKRRYLFVYKNIEKSGRDKNLTFKLFLGSVDTTHIKVYVLERKSF